MATATQAFGLTGTLEGLEFGMTGTNELITSVTKALDATITAPSGTYAPAVTISATVANGSLVTLKKALLINRSATITSRISLVDDTAKAAYLELLPKSSHFIDTVKIETKEDGSGFTAFTDINTVSVAGVSGTADIAILALGT
jgi:hypothetical protein